MKESIKSISIYHFVNKFQIRPQLFYKKITMNNLFFIHAKVMKNKALGAYIENNTFLFLASFSFCDSFSRN